MELIELAALLHDLKGVSSSSPRPLKSSGKNRFCAAPDWKYSGSDTAGAKCAKEFLEGHKYDTKKVTCFLGCKRCIGT